MKNRKYKALLILLAALLALGLPAGSVQAEHYSGSDDWKVSFTSDKKMVSNFKSSDMDDTLMGLQPGDDAEFEVAVKNEYPEKTSWYMTNKILESLEDASQTAQGGAYTYVLTYTGPDGKTKTLFDSDMVGGEDVSEAGEGLHEATNALEDFFLLDDLNQGQSGTVKLTVALEGETQGNDYQDTLAELQMNFAVELAPEETKPQTVTQSKTSKPTTTTTGKKSRNIVKTGDNSDMIRYIIMAAVSGALLLVLGFISLFLRKKDEKNAKGAR